MMSRQDDDSSVVTVMLSTKIVTRCHTTTRQDFVQDRPPHNTIHHTRRDSRMLQEIGHAARKATTEDRTPEKTGCHRTLDITQDRTADGQPDFDNKTEHDTSDEHDDISGLNKIV